MSRKGTRGAQGAGTIRKYSNSLWQGRITLPRDPGTGKQIQKSFYGKTQKEVQQKMNAALAEVDKGLYIAPGKLSVAEWLDLWAKDYLGNVKEGTSVSYHNQIENHIKPAIGAVKLSALAPHQIQSFYNDLSKELAAKSIKNVHGVLHRSLRQAVLNQLIHTNPADSVILPKIQKREINPFDEKQLDAFLKVIKDYEHETLFKVDLFTGLRQGEIMGLTWDRIDFDEGTITIDRQLIREKKQGGVFKFASTKTDNIRIIKPAPIVIEWLKQQKKKQAAQKLKAGNRWQEGELKGLVFTNSFGKPVSNTTLSHAAKKKAEKIGVIGFRFHDLRHTYAVHALRAGDNIKVVSANLGHATVTITLDIYCHFTQDFRNDSSENMSNYMQRFGNL